MTPYLQTHSGRILHILDPKPNQICFQDIVVPLTRICRFNGHTREFYSVAQHSICCAKLATEIESDNPRFALACLLHDAAEAYVGDMPSPVKVHVPEYRKIEDNILNIIFEKFHLGCFINKGYNTYGWSRIMHVDLRILFTEKRDVLTHHHEWDITPEEPAPWHIVPTTPIESLVHFNTVFRLLMERCNLDPEPFVTEHHTGDV